MLNIKKYKDYFHDGGLIDIYQKSNSIALSMRSSELSSEIFDEEVNLSLDNYLKGKLHILDVKKVSVNEVIAPKVLSMKHDAGQIVNLEIDRDTVTLEIIWVDFPPKKKLNPNCSIYKIRGGDIYWENIPDLVDPYW